MQSVRNDNLGFYVTVFKYKEEMWIRGKDICLSTGYKDYRNAIRLNVDSIDKKKPACQDKRYRCLFLNKSGVYSLINKSRKTTIKYQFIEWLEDEVYNNNNNNNNNNKSVGSSAVRIYEKDYEAPKKFKSNGYKKRNYKRKTKCELNGQHKEIIEEAIKEAFEDAEMNYYGLTDYLKEDDKHYNKVFTKYYDKIYDNVDEDKEPEQLNSLAVIF